MAENDRDSYLESDWKKLRREEFESLSEDTKARVRVNTKVKFYTS